MHEEVTVVIPGAINDIQVQKNSEASDLKNILPLLPKIKSIYEGSIDAKIQLIVYESLTCGHCASFHKNVYPDLNKLNNINFFKNKIPNFLPEPLIVEKNQRPLPMS